MQNFGNNHSDGHQSEGEDQADNHILDEASEDVSHKGNSGSGHSVGQLSLNVVQVVALATGRSHDGGIGDGGAVVAADGTGHTSGNQDGTDGLIAGLEANTDFGESSNDDGDQDTESTPGSTGSEGHDTGDDEDDGGQHGHHTTGEAFNQSSDVFLQTQGVGHRLQGPGEGQDQDGGDHGLEAFGNQIHHLTEGQDLTNHVPNNGDDHAEEGTISQTQRGVGVGEGFGEGNITREETAGVDQTDDTHNNQNNNGEDQVDNLTLGAGLFVFSVSIGTVGSGVDVALLNGVLFMGSHGTKFHLHDGHDNHHEQGQQSVVVIGDSADKEIQTINAINKTGNSGSPGGDGSDDTDGSGGGVDQISQLSAGNIVLVGQGTHNSTDGQAVEIVVDKDQATQSNNRQLSGDTGLDVLNAPLTESGRTAGGVDQLNHNAQQHVEDQNTNVVGVRQVSDDTVVKDMGNGAHKVEVGKHSGANGNTQEQRGINFLGDQGQTDSDDGGQSSPQGVVSEAFAHFSGKTADAQQSGDAQSQKQDFHEFVAFHDKTLLF